MHNAKSVYYARQYCKLHTLSLYTSMRGNRSTCCLYRNTYQENVKPNGSDWLRQRLWALLFDINILTRFHISSTREYRLSRCINYRFRDSIPSQRDANFLNFPLIALEGDLRGIARATKASLRGRNQRSGSWELLILSQLNLHLSVNATRYRTQLAVGQYPSS